MKRYSMFALALLIGVASVPSVTAFEMSHAISSQVSTFAPYDAPHALTGAASVTAVQAVRLASEERERVNYLNDSDHNLTVLNYVGAYVATAPLAVGGWPS